MTTAGIPDRRTEGGPERNAVPDTDVTYALAGRSLDVPPEVQQLLDRKKSLTVVWARDIRRGEATYAGMYCGPPANLLLVDVAQDADDSPLGRSLGIGTLVHEIGHALFTPAQQEAGQKRHAAGLVGQDLILYDGFLDVLEDERIERQILKGWPALAARLERRWTWILETYGRQAIESGALGDYGRAQARHCPT